MTFTVSFQSSCEIPAGPCGAGVIRLILSTAQFRQVSLFPALHRRPNLVRSHIKLHLASICSGVLRSRSHSTEAKMTPAEIICDCRTKTPAEGAVTIKQSFHFNKPGVVVQGYCYCSLTYLAYSSSYVLVTFHRKCYLQQSEQWSTGSVSYGYPSVSC